MGAIFGIVGDGSLREVRAMGAAVKHRGQHQAYWSPARGVYFGQADHRPFEVDGSPLATDWHVAGDQSTLLDRFAVDGPAALAGLRGTFSLALCGGPGTVWLAVDHMGFKSLYYALLPNRLVFASEYKSLLALADIPLEPNRTAIQHYLATKNPLDGQAFLACARSVKPGQVIKIADAHITASAYWKPSTAVVERSHEGHVRVVREALLQAVERQVSPYEQIGVTLGAGIDAAIVLGAVRRVAPDVRVSSFTIGAGETDWEIVGARETASLFGTEHHEYVFDPAAVRTDLPRLVWLTEDCGGREEVMLQMHVLAHAAAHTKAIFGGYSADRVFGGMPRHRLVGYAERLPLLNAPLREVFQLTQCGAAPSSLAGRALKRALYGSAPPEALPVPGAAEVPSSVYWAPELNRFICGTVQGCPSYHYLEPFHEIGGASFHSPFLDPDLIAVSLTVPSWLKTGWRRQKRVLREATTGIVPQRIVTRSKAIQRLDFRGKMGEVLCGLADEWLVNSAIQQYRLLTDAQLQHIRRDLSRARQSREVAIRLWSVLSLECWARHFLSAKRGEPAPATI
jgi:asparagine synthase (glutamine-hydrolysing)